MNENGPAMNENESGPVDEATEGMGRDVLQTTGGAAGDTAPHDAAADRAAAGGAGGAAPAPVSGRRRWLAPVAIGATGLLVLGGAAVAIASMARAPESDAAATVVAAPAAVPASAHGRARLELWWSRLPADLRYDLLAVRAADPGDRPAMLAEIREGAESGEYGERVEARWSLVQARVEQWFAGLPAGLQQDLQQLRAAAPDARPQLARDIRDAALAGDYGSDVQRRAEQLQDVFVQSGLRGLIRDILIDDVLERS